MSTEDKKPTAQNSPQKNNTETLETLEEIILSDCQEIIKSYNIEDIAAKAIISQTIESSQFFTHALWHFYDVVRKFYPNIFNLISPKGFLLIIQHLRRVVFQKIESRNVGASIILFINNEQVEQLGNYHIQVLPLINSFGDIKNFFNEKELDLVRAYKGIKSNKAFFAFVINAKDNTIQFKGIKAFGENSFTTICGDDAIGFNLSEGVPCIRLYNQGERIVDYMLSEATGNWVIRPEKELYDIIAKQLIGVMQQDIKTLTKAIMQLSYLRIGAMLVITSNVKEFENDKTYYKLQSNGLENDMREELIYQYAANDGAVIIHKIPERHLVAEKIGVILNPTGNKYDKSLYKALVNDYNCGSRHEKAARYACEHPNDCVIVISENRSISILHGENPIFWRDVLYN